MPDRAGRARRVAALAAAALLLHLLLILPNHPGATVAGALRTFPLELPAILLLLLLAPGAPARAAVTAALTLMTLVKLADLAAFLAYARPFNPVLDRHLLPASARMLTGALGLPLALVAAAGLAAGIAALAAALWWATGRVAAAAPAARRPALAALALAAVALAAADAARDPAARQPPGSAFTARLAMDRLRDAAGARADLARFRAEAARDPAADLPPERILPALRGTDVLVVVVESYGRAALDNPRYAPTVRGTLAELEPRLAARGLAMRSGFLVSPVVGGQSWLAHASLFSGLPIDSQGRYAALLASPRRTLLHLARAAGWHTAAVMPAITIAWPEAGFFGYDTVLAAADLGYRGKPFNWVTMPDQFTLAALERRLLGPAPRAPVFAEVALISSHAPWTPVPPLLPWEAIGDGRVFDRHAVAGDPPEEVWRDRERVRDQFRQALDYTLRTLGSFAERRAAEAPLIVVLGDHQPVPFVSEDPAGRDVPVHVIGAPDQVARLAPWGWAEGMLPAADAPSWPMHAFRDRFLAAFGPQGTVGEDPAARRSVGGAAPG